MDGLVVKSTRCSYRGPGFSSWHHTGSLTTASDSCSRASDALLFSIATILTHTNPHADTHMYLKIIATINQGLGT